MKKRVYFNEDGDHIYFTLLNMGKKDDVTEEELRQYIRQYANTSITDFLFCVNMTVSVPPSKVKTSLFERAYVTEERGINVDYTDTVAMVAHNIWIKHGIDLFKIYIEELNKMGINPWMSFRMNDCHCLFNDAHYLVASEYYDNFDKHSRIRHREQSEYFDRCLDFEVDWVRKYTKDYIEEMLERYDIYGVEFDFQREFDCFGVGREDAARDLMTDFVGELKELVTKYEEKRGHKIHVAMHCHQSPEYCYELGFDIVEMAKRGLMDVYIASPRWLSADMDMPLNLWKQILEPYGVGVVGGIYDNISNLEDRNSVFRSTYETACALAGSVLSQEADVYLFNHFQYESLINPKIVTEVVKPENGIFSGDGLSKFLNIAGNLDAILQENRKCLVTPVDKAPLWRKNNCQLPISMGDSRKIAFLKITTGKITEGRVVLNVGVSGDICPQKDIEVYVNSTPVRFVKTKKCGQPMLTENTIYEFEIEKTALSKHSQVAEFIVNNGVSITIDYADIEISTK